MNPLLLLPPVDPSGQAPVVDPSWAAQGDMAIPGEFTTLLANGLSRIETKLRSADEIATRFAIDDSVPPHQVMIALEEARTSMGLMLQVRSRLVQGLTQLMQMQI